MRINSESLADVQFTLKWSSGQVCHVDSYFGPSVNMWRDCFTPQLFEALSGLTPGDQVTFEATPGELLQDVSDGLVKKIKKNSFGSFHGSRRNTLPKVGRFYPKGLLRDLPGVFSNNVEPFRCIEVDENSLTVDFNHPLAGKPLTLNVSVESVVEKESERGGSCYDWIETVTTGPGMQARCDGFQTDFALNSDSNGNFRRDNETPDAMFYEKPRMVNHLDDRAREEIQKYYRRNLKPGIRILDLMASWESHLTDADEYEHITGLGMNLEELKANPVLRHHVVHDLNQTPCLPFADTSFDAVICTVSIEYLTRPLEVFQDIHRILSPGGIAMFSFSNRWFPPKVVRLWEELHEFERMGYVSELFLNTSGFEAVSTYSQRGLPRPYTDKYFPQQRFSDPVFVVSGKKQVRT